MKYTLENGKVVNIPDKELENLQKTLEISKDDAIWTWLCDNDYISDETVEELSEKAKKNRILHGAKAEKSEKTRKTREKKENPTKRQIIEVIFDALSEYYAESASVIVQNPEKYIDLTLSEGNFTINLVQHREKKEK